MVADVQTGVIFRPDIIETIDEAFERAQIDNATITERHLQSARRSLNYILIKISARFPQLWLVEELTFPLSGGQKTITFDEGIIDVVSAVSRDAQGLDTPMVSTGRDEYFSLPDKEQRGSRPDRIWLDRSSVDAPVGYLWQVPSQGGTSVVVNVMRYAKGAFLLDKHPEVPIAWQDALADLLSVKLAQKYNDKALPVCVLAAKESEREAKMASAERADVTITMRHNSKTRRRARG